MDNYMMYNGTDGVYTHTVKYERDPTDPACSAGTAVHIQPDMTLKQVRLLHVHCALHSFSERTVLCMARAPPWTGLLVIQNPLSPLLLLCMAQVALKAALHACQSCVPPASRYCM